jgi:hypothetical protein
LKLKVILIPSLISKPDEIHCSSINLIINLGLLLLSTKKGSDKFKVGTFKDFEPANSGINK